MISKRASNNNSTLLDQLVKAAENASPKENNDFRDCVIKIAGKSPPTLEQSLQNLIRDQKIRKMAQQPGVLEGPDAGLDNVGGIDLNGPESAIGGLEEDPTAAASDAIWDALVALKGSPEEAQAFIDEKMSDPALGSEDLPPAGEPEPMMSPMEAEPGEMPPMAEDSGNMPGDMPGEMPAPMPMM